MVDVRTSECPWSRMRASQARTSSLPMPRPRRSSSTQSMFMNGISSQNSPKRSPATTASPSSARSTCPAAILPSMVSPVTCVSSAASTPRCSGPAVTTVAIGLLLSTGVAAMLAQDDSADRWEDQPMHPRAGTVALPEDLVDLDALTSAYYDRAPDLDDPSQQVVFGTSGHRGSSLDGAFNEAHIVAITAAIVEYRRSRGTDGPLFIGRDTHALSLPAWETALEVLAAAGVDVHIDARDGYTPTPAVSHAILLHNGAATSEGVHLDGASSARTGLADGIVVTPSHNPPRDGGFKYNPPHGGPADSDATGWIAARANELLRSGVGSIRRLGLEAALAAPTTRRHDFMSAYVDDLATVLDLELIRAVGVRIGADPLGGASVDYWGAIGERLSLIHIS